MKKKYVQPTTKLHKIGVHHMICQSPGINNEGTDANQLTKEVFDDDFDW